MIRETYSPNLCLLIFLAVILCSISGCKKNPPQAEDKGNTEVVAKVNTTVPLYKDDTGRLNTIVERLNKHCGSNHTAIFGSGINMEGPLITVDYGSFDRLSDDGVAAMIAKALSSVSISNRMTVNLGANQTRPQAGDILASDVVAGKLLARAGFSAKGFREWLDMQNLSPLSPADETISETLRTEAFMQGFLSERSK